MRITAYALSFPPARLIGAELALATLLEHLQAAGHSVLVETKAKAEATHFRTLRTRTSRPGYRGEPDLVVTNAGLVGEAKRRWSRTPLLVYVHNLRFPTLSDLRTRAGIPGTALVANSHHMAAALQDIFPGSDPSVLYPAWSQVAPDPLPAPEAGHLLVVGFSRDKGSELVTQMALAEPDIQFCAISGGHGVQDTSSRPSNLDVLPHGTLDAGVWSRTEALLVPSTAESFSMVAAEAAARGIPVIHRGFAGVREAAGPAGYTPQDGSAEAWLATAHAAVDKPRRKVHKGVWAALPGQLQQVQEIAEGLVRT